MPKIIEGHLSAADKKFCLVVSRFNDLVSQRLVDGALDCIIRHGGSDANVELVWVPGSFRDTGRGRQGGRFKKIPGGDLSGCRHPRRHPAF